MLRSIVWSSRQLQTAFRSPRQCFGALDSTRPRFELQTVPDSVSKHQAAPDSVLEPQRAPDSVSELQAEFQRLRRIFLSHTAKEDCFHLPLRFLAQGLGLFIYRRTPHAVGTILHGMCLRS